MKEQNEGGVKMHLKFVHKSTSLIITLNTVIWVFSKDSIIVKCMQFTLWCIHEHKHIFDHPSLKDFDQLFFLYVEGWL